MKYRLPFFGKTVFLLLAVIIVSLSGLYYLIEKRAIQHEAEENLVSIARLKIDQIVTWRKDRLKEGAEILIRPRLVEHLTEWLIHDQQKRIGHVLISELKSFRQQHDIENILVVATNGNVRFNLDGPLEDPARYSLELVKAFRNRLPVLSDLHKDIVNPKPHISVVVPLFLDREQNLPAGAVVLITDPSQFLYPLIQLWPVKSDSAETLLVRRDGDDVLFLNTVRHQADTALKLRIPLSKLDLPAAMAIKGERGVAIGYDYRGVKVVSILLAVPESPWFMVAKVDAEEIFAPWRSRAVLIIGLLACLLAMVGAFALFARQYEQKRQYRSLYQTEAELRAISERHSVTLRSIGDAVILSDAKGHIELLNSAAEELTGWSDEDAKGRPSEEIFHLINEHNCAPVENPLAKVIRDDTVVGLAYDTLLIAKNSIERPVAFSGAPIHNTEGAITGVVLVFRDQTGERDSQKKILESESFYRQTLESIPGMVFTTRPDGYCDYQSQQWIDYTGVPMSEHLGDGWNQLLHPEDRPRAFAAWRSAVEKKAPYNLEYRVRRHDGVYEWFKVIGHSIHDSDGSIVRWIGTALNIEALKQTEEALRQSESRFRAIFNQAGVGIAILAPSLRIEAVNDVQCAILGYSEKELIGMSVLNLTHPDDLEAYRQHVDKILIGEKTSFTFDKRDIKKDGNYTWTRLTVSVIKDADGRPQSLISVIVDINDHKRAEETILRLNETLEQKVVERTRLAEARNRQLQTLTVQLIEAEESERRRIAELLHDDLQQIIAAAWMQLESVSDSQPNASTISFIKQLLKESIDKSRHLSHELSPPVLQHADLPTALQWLSRHFNSQFGLQVEISVKEIPKCESELVKLFIFRAIQELLFNIVKHAGVKTAHVELFNSDGFLMVTVSDRGRGINPDVINSAEIPSGLGLLSLRERAHHIGGSIIIESDPELGSSITLKVPFRVIKGDEQIIYKDLQQAGTSIGNTIDAHSEPIRVLFVDDHKVMRQGLINLIGTQPGICVAGEASNGREAIDRVGQLNPDVVVMDVFMPIMNGIEATQYIKAHWPNVWVIALSMIEDEQISQTMHEAGADVFMSKTVSSADLLRAIYGGQ